MHRLDGLLEALDTAVDLRGDSDLFAEELREAARTETDLTGEFGDGSGAGRPVEVGQSEVDH